MTIKVSPRKLMGQIWAIASKSDMHRLLICAALSTGNTRIVCKETSADIEATAACLRALGAGVCYENGVYHVSKAMEIRKNAYLDCGESGSTLRFILPVVCALGKGATIKMRGRLSERPLSPLWEELERHSCKLSRSAPDEIAVQGKMSGGRFEISGDVSSQFISGLLFALPLVSGGEIKILGHLESEGYVNMTRAALSAFGVSTSFSENVFSVPGADYTTPGEVKAEGDWSNGAFWLCARAIGNDVTCWGLDDSSKQWDKNAPSAAAEIMRGNAEIDAQNIPDLVPILSVVAAAAPGETKFFNAARLRIKESDRIFSTVQMLKNLGAEAFETEDGLVVRGGAPLRGGRVNSFNDHRIAMSAAICSTICEKDVIIEEAQAVSKSYPAFWDDFEALGGVIEREGGRL